MCNYAEVSNSVIRKARKDHKCQECGRTISKGDTYLHSSGIFDHEPFSSKTCLDCNEIYEFLQTLPETECIDTPLYEYLQGIEYISDQRLKKVNGYWKLVKE